MKSEINLPSILRNTISGMVLLALVAKGGDADSSKSPSRVRIGNYLVTAPTGIAFVADDAAAFVLDFAGVNERPDPHYTWSALMCLIGLESIVDVGNDGQVKTGRGFTEDIELNHIPLQGKMRRITIRNGQVDIK